MQKEVCRKCVKPGFQSTQVVFLCRDKVCSGHFMTSCHAWNQKIYWKHIDFLLSHIVYDTFQTVILRQMKWHVYELATHRYECFFTVESCAVKQANAMCKLGKRKYISQIPITFIAKCINDFHKCIFLISHCCQL